MDEYIFRLYRNESYVVDNVSQECYVSYIPEAGLFLSTTSDTFKILQKPTFELNESNIDLYVISRGFEKVLEFDKSNIKWFNGYEESEKRSNIKAKIPTIKNSIKSKTKFRVWSAKNSHVMYVNLNLLESML